MLGINATIVGPLKNALRGRDKKDKIIWNPNMEEAFEELKKKLTENPVLYAQITNKNLSFKLMPQIKVWT